MAPCLRQSLKAHDPVVFEYECAHRVCPCLHEGDLLRGVETILVETRIPETGIQPDIRLEGSKGKFIEIVHTHKPEDPILAFTQSNRITLVQINVESIEDLDGIQDGTLTAQTIHNFNGCPCKAEARKKKSMDGGAVGGGVTSAATLLTICKGSMAGMGTTGIAVLVAT